MLDGGRLSFGTHSGCAAGGEANLAVNAAEQEGTKVRRQGTTLKIGAHGMASNGRKTQWVWRRIRHRQAFFGLHGIGFAQALFYQRLGEGLPFFMNNSG
jgi:hypothetical protein